MTLTHTPAPDTRTRLRASSVALLAYLAAGGRGEQTTTEICAGGPFKRRTVVLAIAQLEDAALITVERPRRLPRAITVTAFGQFVLASKSA